MSKENKEVEKVVVRTERPKQNPLQAKVDKMSKQLSAATERNKTLQAQVKNSKSLVKEVKRFKTYPAVAKAAAGLPTSSACSEDSVALPFHTVRKSKYLNSLLVPEDGPCTIPDQNMRMHVVRVETVTANLDMVNDDVDSSNVSGLLMLYPNHPTELIGFNFIRDAQGFYGVPQKIVTAQQLYQSYDYGRKTSQIISVRSSTLPSGMYAINGTFNAVRVDGTPSEMGFQPDQDVYNTLLQNTSYGLDKIGNVSVGNGVSVLAIPDGFAVPYTRLNDASPYAQEASETAPAFTITANQIADAGLDLKYHFEGYTTSLPAAVGGTVNQIFYYNLNLDSTTGVEFNADILLQNLGSGAANCNIFLSIQYYDPFGNEVDEAGGSFLSVPYNAGGPFSATFHGTNLINGNWTPSAGKSAGPIAGAAVLINMQSSGTISAGGQCNVNLTFTALNGKASGINSPVVYVAYDNVAKGSVITLSGLSNYELIPNPELRKNLSCSYGRYDPDEMAFVETIVSNRNAYLIRSVYDSTHYEQRKEQFRALSDMNRHHEIANSLGWSDLLKFAKRALPVASRAIKAVVPETAGVVDSLENMFSSKAASGFALSRAADTAYAASLALAPKIVRKRRTMPKRSTKFSSAFVVKRRPKTPSIDNLKTVLFPTVDTDQLDRAVGVSLWAVVEGDHRELLHGDYISTPTPDGHMAYGIKRAGGLYTSPLFGTPLPINTGSDITFVPVDLKTYAKTKRFVPLLRAPQLMGHSCDGAIWLLANGNFSGVYPDIITGEISFKDGRPCLQPNPLYAMKAAALNDLGLPLVAANAPSRFAVTDLNTIRTPGLRRSLACDTTLAPTINLAASSQIVDDDVAFDQLLTTMECIAQSFNRTGYPAQLSTLVKLKNLITNFLELPGLYIRSADSDRVFKIVDELFEHRRVIDAFNDDISSIL